MTIVTGATRTAALATAGQANNPFVTGAPLPGTYTTPLGVEGQPASNAYSGTTFDPWTVTAGSASVRWRVDFGSAQTPTFAAIAAHNLADLGASVRVRYSDDDVTYTNSESGIVTPTDNQSIGWRFSDGAHRYWDVLISGLTVSDIVSIGVIWFGSEIILPQRFYQGYRPPITPTTVDLRTNVSEGAHMVGSAYIERGSTFGTDVTLLTPAFVRGATWTAFQRRWNTGHGAFWAWRPTKYGDLYYAWRAGDAIAPVNSGPKDYMSLSISGRAYHE